MNITYRPASLNNDVPELVNLLEELGYGTENEALIARLNDIRSRKGEVFVAVHENNVIGCIHVFNDLRLAEGEAGEVATLVVNKEYRGNRIGQELLAQARYWAVKQGLKVFKVRSNLIRERAHQFYFDQGFEELKNQKVFSADLR